MVNYNSHQIKVKVVWDLLNKCPSSYLITHYPATREPAGDLTTRKISSTWKFKGFLEGLEAEIKNIKIS